MFHYIPSQSTQFVNVQPIYGSMQKTPIHAQQIAQQT